MAREFSPARGDRALRVLHCPWNVAGQSAELAAAERALGADSRCVVLEETANGFPADERLTVSGDGQIVRELARYRLLWRAMWWADVVHFSFGQSCLVPNAFPGFENISWRTPRTFARRMYARLLWMKDVPLLAAVGKRLAVTWQGDDARQHDRSLDLFEISIARELGDAYYVRGSDAWKRRTIEVFARHVPLHYALNPDLLHVLPQRARFMPYASLDPGKVQCAPRTTEGRRLVFAHAPSHRGAKGTRYVLAAADQLRSEGLEFDLDLIEAVPRDAAMIRYAQCDVVIDQLLAGWYGGLAVEAMTLGKPVVAYIRRGDLVVVDRSFVADLPIIEATPATIATAMRDLIAMPRAELVALGERSRAFVERWHDPLKIARQTLASYVSDRDDKMEVMS